MTLLARVELKNDEVSQASFLERMAAVSGCPSAASFCRDLGLNLTAIRKGRREPLRQLGAAAKADVAQLIENAIIEVAPRSFEIRGCHVISNMLRTDELALCPECIAADLDAGAALRNPYVNIYLRIPWHFRAIETCTVHHRRLERFSIADTKYERRSFATFGWDAAYCLQAGDRKRAEQAPSDLERYITGRLMRAASGIWFDDIPLSEVTRLCKGFGKRILEESERNGVAGTPNISALEVSDLGFQKLKTGPSTIFEFLTDSLLRHEQGRKRVGIRKPLGPFLTGLVSERDYATTDFRILREEVEKFVRSTQDVQSVKHSMPKGANSFGLSEIARHFDISLEAATYAAEEIGAKPYDRFDAPTADLLARQASKLIQAKEAREMLQITNAGLWCLADKDLLGPVHRNDTFKANRRFRPWAIATLLQKLKLAASQPAGMSDWITPSEAAVRYSCSLDRVLVIILSGSLQRISHDEQLRGLPAIRFCQREFFRSLVEVPWFGLSMTQSARRLGVSFEVFSALLREGFLHGQRHREGAKEVVYISEASLEDFENRYVPAAALATISGTSSSAVMRDPDRRGIKPAILRSRCKAYFYLRESLAR